MSANSTKQNTPPAKRQPLSAIFSPQNIAVIGATEKQDSVGCRVMQNLIKSFQGTIIPINPKRKTVFDLEALPTIAESPSPVDLAIIVTPAPTVPNIIRECSLAGVKGAIIITAGFKEAGPGGANLEEEISQIIQANGLRIIGPNCLGVMRPGAGLNATFLTSMALPGNVGFISQSGAMCAAILDWSFREKMGFSAFVSIGSMLDVGWGDLIYELGDDPQTKSIVIYMESVGNARAFLSAAREVALSKPIIVLKAGRTEAAAKAVVSHTGTLADSDEVLNAAFRRIGVLRVEHTAELFYMAEVLAKQPRPAGPNLTIMTNAGGPGVLAADALIQGGGKLANLSTKTLEQLDGLLPAHWSHSNPIDVLADTDAGKYAQTIQVVTQDSAECDGFLVICAPMGIADQTKTAELMAKNIKFGNKPVLASWMGGAGSLDGENRLRRANIPTFPFPETAARIFNYMWKYNYNLRGIYETPSLSHEDNSYAQDRAKINNIISQAREQKRTLLSEFESKQILKAYNIPTTPSQIANNEDEAVAIAHEIGYPVVLKLHSTTITHKTDVGGVKLNLGRDVKVREVFTDIKNAVTNSVGAEHFQGITVQPMISHFGYELIVGSSIDPQFGPVLLFGSGGQLVEVNRDRALALPPLNATLARRMIEQTTIYQALQGARGREAVDLDALEQLLVTFSQLIVEQPWIKEIDINPLLARPGKLHDDDQPAFQALDARVVLHPPDTAPDALPRPAIRPYPSHYANRWTMRNGDAVNIRPIRPEDELAMVAFHSSLSDQSVYLRYFHYLNLGERVSHKRLSRLCFIDYAHEVALVVEHQNQETGKTEIIAVGRLVKLHNSNDAEFAIVISDVYQKCGLG
ncbi:MAG: bifunctional acetate--CoA ligase family protein/GNAT family N-acetyltransferase, partial [bacterium]